MLVDPLGVARDDEECGVADARVKRKLGYQVHDLRYHLVVAGVYFGTHRSQREQGCLDLLPRNVRTTRETVGDHLVRSHETLLGPKDEAAVLQGVPHDVAETPEVVCLLARERGHVVREVQVTDNDSHECLIRFKEDGRHSGLLPDALRQTHPEVERDRDNIEVMVCRTFPDGLHYGVERFGMMQE